MKTSSTQYEWWYVEGWMLTLPITVNWPGHYSLLPSTLLPTVYTLFVYLGWLSLFRHLMSHNLFWECLLNLITWLVSSPKLMCMIYFLRTVENKNEIPASTIYILRWRSILSYCTTDWIFYDGYIRYDSCDDSDDTIIGSSLRKIKSNIYSQCCACSSVNNLKA